MATINPFEIKPDKVDSAFTEWSELYQQAYDKREVDPYTRVRAILMNGTEFEAVGFKHQLARHCVDNDLRREIALLRRVEQFQQKAIASLKPKDENLLEHTIGYEQLAVDLTAIMAQTEADAYVKSALDFALLEDFDHLYRFADLLEMEQGVEGEKLVGSYTEIMPGRPTISEHRYPHDDVKRRGEDKKLGLLTKLHTHIITAAEQQTMNYYMNIGAFHPTELGRKLFTEIGMIEEQHVTQYESLMDSSTTWLEQLLMHEYAECYLYWSAYCEETDEKVKRLWERHFAQEVAHLHNACELLRRYENKEWQQIISGGEFPTLLSFNANIQNNKAYVRNILQKTANNTAILEDYALVSELPSSFRFFHYNATINGNTKDVPSHKVINDYIAEFGQDYRFEETPHPLSQLRDRTKDNTTLGR